LWLVYRKIFKNFELTHHYIFVGYNMTLWYTYTLCGNQIRVIFMSITSNIYLLIMVRTFKIFSSSDEGILRERVRARLHNFYYSILLQLLYFLVVIVNHCCLM
jgi:hypothetical protein